MNPAPAPEIRPYKGLRPYTVEDQVYFFGRERDEDIIESNLDSATLTILHGASGVGKSSVLMAGVLPRVRETPGVAVVLFREWQTTEFLTALKRELLRAVGEKVGGELKADEGKSFSDLVRECNQRLGGPVFFIFDQFEEYFQYHAAPPGDGRPPSAQAEHFDLELARAVNRRDVKAHFLLSLREDSLSKLDRLSGRIPNLLGNTLRLEHLNRESAEEAIRGPLGKFNDLHPERKPVKIEGGLVKELLDQIEAGGVNLDRDARASAQPGAAAYGIETPFLQIVLERLWEEEEKTWEAAEGESDWLRLETLNRLGGAAEIVRTHLDKVMSELDEIAAARGAAVTGERAREVAAAVFGFLVTPSLTKWAHTAGDLTSLAGMPADRRPEVEAVLELLASSEVRVLRPVQPPLGQTELRYEIFHDVLAPAILAWRERQLKTRAQAEAKARAERAAAEARAKAEKAARRLIKALGWGLAAAVIIAVAAVLVTAYARRQQSQAEDAQAQLTQANEELKRAELKLKAQNEELVATASQRDEQNKQLLAAREERDEKIKELEATTVKLSEIRDDLAASQAAEVKKNADLNTALAKLEVARKSLEDSNELLKARNKELAEKESALIELYKISSGLAEDRLRTIKALEDTQNDLKDAIVRLTKAEEEAISLIKTVEGIDRLTPYFEAILRPGGKVVGVARTPGGGNLVSVSADGEVSFWEKGQWRSPRALFKDGAAEAVSGDGRFVVAAGGGGAAVWDCEAIIKGQGTECTAKTKLSGHQGEIAAAAFDAAGGRVALAGKDGKVRVWNAATGSLLREVSGRAGGPGSVALSPDGTLLAATGPGNEARVWEVDDTSGEATGQPLRGFQKPVNSVAFSPGKGQYLVAAGEDGTARVWELQKKEPDKPLKVRREVNLRPRRALIIKMARGLWLPVRFYQTRADRLRLPFNSAAFSKRGNFVVTGGADGVVRVWDVKTNTQLRELRGHSGEVLSVAFDDAGYIVSSSEDGTVRVWQPCMPEPPGVDLGIIAVDAGLERFERDFCQPYK